MLYILLFFGIVILDQLTKALVDGAFAVGEGVSIIDGIFSITNARNPGAAFSMLENETWSQVFFIVMTVIALGVALGYLVINKKDSIWLNCSIVTIMGGAVGNFIDRIVFQEVRDFLYIEFFANCNVADVAITVGACMFIIYLLFLDNEALFKKKQNGKD